MPSTNRDCLPNIMVSRLGNLLPWVSTNPSPGSGRTTSAEASPGGKPYTPACKLSFPSRLNGVSPNNSIKAINKVTPSLIRTEADEVSYHFHVMIRYELEKRLHGRVPGRSRYPGLVEG